MSEQNRIKGCSCSKPESRYMLLLGKVQRRAESVIKASLGSATTMSCSVCNSVEACTSKYVALLLLLLCRIVV